MTDCLTTMINFALHPKDTPITTLNGPGERFALWVQGCSLHCTDECISPQMLDARPRHVLAVADAWDTLVARAQICNRQIEGITLLGGEPTDQAVGLAALASAAHAVGWSVVTYTGYTIEALRRMEREGVANLLSETDILVDGPFVPKLRDPMLRWRGSSNQRVLFLSDRYSAEQVAGMPIQKGTDITVTADHRVIVSGMQNTVMLSELVESLRRKGIIE